MRSERYSTPQEIKRRFSCAKDPDCGAGPILFYDKREGIYVDDGEGHIGVYGRSGVGKSQCTSLPFARNVLSNGESLLVLDPKGELWTQLSCHIPDHYLKLCLDFRCPSKSAQWNPLSTIIHYMKSPDIEDQDLGQEMLANFAAGIYPTPADAKADPFWNQASQAFLTGIVQALIELGIEEKFITMQTVSTIMSSAEKRIGSTSLLKSLYDYLPDNSMAKTSLSTVALAPNETRGSILSVSTNSIQSFSRSRGLMSMLSRDSLEIHRLNMMQPFAIFIIIPDETQVFDPLAASYVNQISLYAIRTAQQQPSQRLPIRVNMLLEEVGSLGSGIPLPQLMTAARSRNIRILIILQDETQLVDLYGTTKASIITSCIGTSICFQTNSYQTLTEWAHRCGEREIWINGTQPQREQLVTPAQLASMPVGTALILADGGRYKWISHLPRYGQIYDRANWMPPESAASRDQEPVAVFSLEEFLKEKQKERLLKLMQAREETPNSSPAAEFLRPPGGTRKFLEDLREGLESLPFPEENSAPKMSKPTATYTVVLVSDGGNTTRVAEVLAANTSMSVNQARSLLKKTPADIPFSSKKIAKEVHAALCAAGANAWLFPAES